MQNSETVNDRALDIAVAEKVMGLIPCQGTWHDASQLPCHAHPTTPAGGRETHRYSTHISAAHEVLERMYTLGYGFEATGSAPVVGSQRVFEVEFQGTDRVGTAKCTTLASAICKAALKAITNEAPESFGTFFGV